MNMANYTFPVLKVTMTELLKLIYTSDVHILKFKQVVLSTTYMSCCIHIILSGIPVAV